MFEISYGEDNEIALEGRFDASQVDKAREAFDGINTTRTVNFRDLDYISSAGLSVLLVTQKRLSENGNQLILKNLNKHIREVFRYAGFDMIFQIL
ncbi:MAG: STAS domain-containing protein [Calditrichia bacterium]